MEKDNPIRILIAEDHEVVRRGLKAIFDQQADFEVIGESSSCKDTLLLSETLSPDITLLGLTLCDGSSLECIDQLRKSHYQGKVLIFTASTDQDTHLRALRYGAVGIVLKSHPTELLCKAIRTTYLSNELWVDKTLTTKMWKQTMLESQHELIKKTAINKDTKQSNNSLAQNTLTPRENQIACLSSKGLAAKQIGEKLFISPKTVRNQLTTIFSKQNVKSQLELSIKCDFSTTCANNHCPFYNHCTD